MRLIVHGTKYIQGSSEKAKVTPGKKESVLSWNSSGEGSKIEGRT